MCGQSAKIDKVWLVPWRSRQGILREALVAWSLQKETACWSLPPTGHWPCRLCFLMNPSEQKPIKFCH